MLAETGVVKVVKGPAGPLTMHEVRYISFGVVTPLTTSVPAETKAAWQLLLAKMNSDAAPLGSAPLCVTDASTVEGVHVGSESGAKQVSRTKACWKAVLGVTRLVAVDKKPMYRPAGGIPPAPDENS